MSSVRGRVTTGKPVADGTYNVTFKIYDNSAGTSPLWSETQTVTIQRGIFNTLIGGVTTGGINLAFDKQYYLGIQVGSDTEMRPLQQLASSAYAFNAENADNAKNADTVGSVAVSTTPAANKLLPLDSNAKLPTSALKVYDSGWFPVNYNDTNHYRDWSHNLGTTKVVATLWFSTASDGSANVHNCVEGIYWANGQYQNGSSIRNLTPTTVRITWGSTYVYIGNGQDGSTDAIRSGYLRLIMLALE